MDHLKVVKEKGSAAKLVALHCLLLVFIIISSYLGIIYYRPFHIIVEAFSSFIALSIFMMAVNSYEISKNIPFLFLGAAYGVAGGFNVIHILASNGVGYFQGDTTNLSMISSIIPRFIIAVSILICCRLFYKTYRILTPFTIISGFSLLFAVLLVWIFYWRTFPDCYIPGYGSTTFKIAGEYIISGITIISALILFKGKKYIEKNTFLLLQLYMYISIAGNILLTFYTIQAEITNVLAHILRAISFYFIYRAIVKVGIKTPYKLLFNELDAKNYSLKLKDSEIEHAIHELKKENALRRNIEEMLVKNEASYKLLIEGSRDAIMICSYDKIIFANEGAARLVEVDEPGKLLGKDIAELFMLDREVMSDFAAEKRLVEDFIAPPFEAQVMNIYGKTVPVEVINAFITFQNKPAILSLIRDISHHRTIEKMKKDVEKDRKLLNETLEFNRLITEFFSNISHELRTPLNVILSALQVLALDEQSDVEGSTAEKRKRYMKIIKQNSYRLLRLINNLIDISRIDSGYVMPRLENHNIVSVVEDIVMSVAEYAEDKGITVVFDTNVEEKIIACDTDKIERIMLNLISNAIKFTDEGDLINIEIIDKGDNVSISVKDNGIGIPQDKLQMIFERFRLVDNSLSRNHEGSGIGLSLVKAFVEMHGGSIKVISSLGEGSEFIINLPAVKLDTQEICNDYLNFEHNPERISIEFSDI